MIHFNKPIVIAPETPESNPTLNQEETEQLLNQYAYCEKDEECTSFYAKCPFGCGRGINMQFLDTAQNLIKNFRQHQLEINGIMCEYDCIEVQKVSCINNTCTVDTKLSNF